jgi:hypothetical protein
LLKLSAWIVGVVLVAATALDVLSVWRSPKHYLGKSRMGVGDILLTGVSSNQANEAEQPNWHAFLIL